MDQTLRVLAGGSASLPAIAKGDGVNDQWNIKYLDTYANCTVEVYNRYGAKLFASTGYTVPWDGTYNGLQIPGGVYYYIINPKHGRSTLSGSLTIIR